MTLTPHPILQQSFAIIDQEIGDHSFSADEYPIVQRVIHSTADFEFKHLLRFSPSVIEIAIAALASRTPIITDVSMVKQGVINLVQQTFNNPLSSAVEQVQAPLSGKTRTETGLLQCLEKFPSGIYVIGNAPTALLALCQQLQFMTVQPALVIGATVGFVAVVESKAALAQTQVPHIYTAGRKGGSPVAAAMLNALLILAWNRRQAAMLPSD
jgi:precorrin-8X/cobalt-precorrin-8 methylmutase